MAVTIGSVTEGNANAEEIKNNLPDSELYEKNKKYLQGSLVKFNDKIYLAKRNVPSDVDLDNPYYWEIFMDAADSKRVDELFKTIGDLADLETEEKDNLVAAINEVKASSGSGEASDAVLYTEQSLTEEQKAQARENIGGVRPVITLDYSFIGNGFTWNHTATEIQALRNKRYLFDVNRCHASCNFYAGNMRVSWVDGNELKYSDIDNSGKSGEIFSSDIGGITGQVTADKVTNPDHLTDLVQYGAFEAAVPLVQSMGITGAQVGQTIKVKAVNEQGMPTAWEATAGESYTLPEATSDTLGGVKADPATANDTQPVRIGTDGKLVTMPAAVSDAQVSSAVSTWLTEHPEATTTVADGAVTGQKLSDDLYKQITGDSRHKLTEVKIDLHYIKYNAWEEQASAGGMRATNIFPTPQYIKIVSHTSDFSVSETIKINAIRFLADEEGTADSSGLERNVYFLRDEVPNDETVIMPTFEYDRVGAGYIQLRFVLTNWQKPMGLFDVYAIYDTWRPTYTLPDDTGEFVYDLPVKYLYNGENDSTYVKLWGIVPYYPGTTYNIRGGYYANILTKDMQVAYLLDDSIFTTWDDGILTGSSNKATLGAIPLYKGIRTTQYDTSVNGGANAAYQWAYVTTPPESELIGPKWVAIVMGNHVQDEKGDKGTEYYSALLAAIEAKGVQNMYITRFNTQVPRSLYAQLAFPNPNYHDDGSKYYAMLTSASKSPLVGAKWTLFGDSLTDNYGGHDLTGSYFATKIAREFNMSFDNRAKSGSNIYRGGSGNYVSVSGMIKLDEFIAEIEAGTTEQPDYITIAFGTNSFTAQLGTNADTSATDTSVYGATKRFIEVLREKCPKSVFGFVLSPKQNWGSSDPYNLRAVDAARTAIKAVCDEYGVPYIDMSTQSGITVDMLPDGIHISNDQSQNLYYHAMRRFMIGL